MEYPISDSEYDRIMSTPAVDVHDDEWQLVQAAMKGQMALWRLTGEVEGGVAVWLREAKSYLADLLELVDSRKWKPGDREIIDDARAFLKAPHV